MYHVRRNIIRKKIISTAISADIKTVKSQELMKKYRIIGAYALRLISQTVNSVLHNL